MNIIVSTIIALSIFFTAFLADSCDSNEFKCPAGQTVVQREGYKVCE